MKYDKPTCYSNHQTKISDFCKPVPKKSLKMDNTQTDEYKGAIGGADAKEAEYSDPHKTKVDEEDPCFQVDRPTAPSNGAQVNMVEVNVPIMDPTTSGILPVSELGLEQSNSQKTNVDRKNHCAQPNASTTPVTSAQTNSISLDAPNVDPTTSEVLNGNKVDSQCRTFATLSPSAIGDGSSVPPPLTPAEANEPHTIQVIDQLAMQMPEENIEVEGLGAAPKGKNTHKKPFIEPRLDHSVC